MTVVNRYEDPVNRTQKLDFDKGMGLTFLSGKAAASCWMPLQPQRRKSRMPHSRC